jgi:type IV pilus assembly protein PilY1
VAYLRGDVLRRSATAASCATGSTVLGDIITSTPVLSSPLDDYGFGRLPGTMGSSYAAYMTTKRNGHRYMVY